MPALLMIQNPVANFKSQIESFAVFKLFNDAKTLLIVFKAAGNDSVQDAFAGMAERRMPEVVPHGYGFGQILIEQKSAGNRSGDLSNLLCVRKPRSVMVADG